MIEFNLESLWLIPIVIAIGFMLWVLWHLNRELKKRQTESSD